MSPGKYNEIQDWLRYTEDKYPILRIDPQETPEWRLLPDGPTEVDMDLFANQIFPAVNAIPGLTVIQTMALNTMKALGNWSDALTKFVRLALEKEQTVDVVLNYFLQDPNLVWVEKSYQYVYSSIWELY